MSEMIEVKTEDGRRDMVRFRGGLDGLTKKKLLSQIDAKTIVKGGEAEHHIENSIDTAMALKETILRRAMERSDNDEFSYDELDDETQNKILMFYKEEIEEIGIDVKKKNQK